MYMTDPNLLKCSLFPFVLKNTSVFCSLYSESRCKNVVLDPSCTVWSKVGLE